MKHATLKRFKTSDEGTFGQLTCEGFHCVTVELPWRDNKPGISCIPAGTYLFHWRTDSPKHGECYEEWDEPTTEVQEDVPDRDFIQIHPANLAGDEEKGFISELRGCIAPGESIVEFKPEWHKKIQKKQHGVAASRAACYRLSRFMKKETFKLTICWEEGENPEPPKEPNDKVGGTA